MKSKKTLECSSRGDRRFSALYAKVSAFGVVDSIENHYQKSKRNAAGGPVKKGQPVDHMVINGRKFLAEKLTDWYRLLWVKYLDENPELVEYARQFDEFSDMFRGKNTVNCQADVIRDYIADREQLVQSARRLTKALRQIRADSCTGDTDIGQNKDCIFPEEDKSDGMCPCEICSIYNAAPLQCEECVYERCPCADWGFSLFTNLKKSSEGSL